MIEFANHGPLITSTNFWESDYESANKWYVSFNANGVRLLVPSALRRELNEMQRNLKHVVISMGPWPEMQRDRAMEIMFEDESDSPYCLKLDEQSTDRKLSGDGRDDLIFIAYTKPRRGRPHKVFERPCFLRSVDQIPCMDRVD